MHKLLLFFAIAFVLAVPLSGQQPAAPSETPRDFPVGTLIPKVVTIANPEQTYALYIPKSYSSTRLSPIIYAFAELVTSDAHFTGLPGVTVL